jgi:hypothetical protein
VTTPHVVAIVLGVGASLSTVLAFHQHRRRVAVTRTSHGQVFDEDGTKLEPYVAIRATAGPRRVEIHSSGFTTAHGAEPWLGEPLNGSTPTPVRLDDGQTATFIYDLRQIRESEAALDARFVTAWVRDGAGRPYSGPIAREVLD